MLKQKLEVDWRWLTIISAFAAALYKANDSFITHRFFNDPGNELVVALTYLIIGGWIGLVSNVVFSRLFGNQVDSRFTWFEWGSTRVQLCALSAGILSAISTFFMLWGSSLFDPSLVIPLGSLTIVFLVFYDLFQGEVSLSDILWPMVLIVVGSVIISLYRKEGSLPEITLKAIVLLLIFRGLFAAVASVFSKVGVGLRDNTSGTNSINFAFWRFLWLVVSGTVFALVFLARLNKISMFVSLVRTEFWLALPFILLTMFFVFLGNALETNAYTLREGKVSKITMLLNVQLILGVPITLLVTRFYPGAFGEISSDSLFWVFKVAGSILIFWGASLLYKQHEVITERSGTS